jgi:DNA repair protein RadC
MTERYRLALVREPAAAPVGNQITHPNDLAQIAKGLLADEPQEIVLCLHLDRKHRIRGYQEVCRGGLDNAAVDLRVLFAGVLVAGTPAFALAHNHPSGDSTPSTDDHALTRRIARAADLLGIEFLDHLVVSTNSWTSLREFGAL